jgi:hypothetical protein
MAATLKLGDRKWATKEGSLLAYNSENNNYKPLPFDFTRASSATRVNKQGLIETVASGVPRIDFTDANGALLLEPQRTNVLLQSNQFDTTWLQTDLTATSGESGYGGSSDAWLLSKSAANGRIRQYVTDTGVQTLSAYFKAGTNNWMRITYGGATTYFDLANGVLGFDSSINATITSVGSGWYRCTFTANVTSAQYAQFYVADSNNDTSGTSGNILIQNAQLEQGSYATSYIPTQGSAVTRIGDVCSQTPPSGIIGQTEGTLFYDFNIEDIALQTQDPVLIYLKNSSGITSYLEMYDNGDLVVVHINSGSITLTKNGLTDGRHKAAFAYKDNDFAFYVDGILAGTNTSFTVASSQTEIGFQYTSVGYIGKQSVNDAQLYNTRLSNAELATLTTI